MALSYPPLSSVSIPDGLKVSMRGLTRAGRAVREHRVLDTTLGTEPRQVV